MTLCKEDFITAVQSVMCNLCEIYGHNHKAYYQTKYPKTRLMHTGLTRPTYIYLCESCFEYLKE